MKKMFLDKCFGKGDMCNQNSPVYEDEEMKKKYDKDGSLIITWEKVDYSKIISSNGSAFLWSLNSLIKAGIDPGSMNIHTGNGTRLEGLGDINNVLSDVDKLIEEADALIQNNNNNDITES